jgi:hypothetical protein
MSITARYPGGVINRSLVAIVLTVGLVATVGVAAAAAAPTRGGCPPGGGNTWERIESPEWVSRSKTGLVLEFGSLEDAATALLGPTGTEEALIEVVEESFDLIDANGDGSICISATNPRGLPDYAFLVKDNKFPTRG